MDARAQKEHTHVQRHLSVPVHLVVERGVGCVERSRALARRVKKKTATLDRGTAPVVGRDVGSVDMQTHPRHFELDQTLSNARWSTFQLPDEPSGARYGRSEHRAGDWWSEWRECISDRGRVAIAIFLVVLLLFVCLRPPVVLVSKGGGAKSISFLPLVALSSLAAFAVYFKEHVGGARGDAVERTTPTRSGSNNDWVPTGVSAETDTKVVHIGSR
tara:strand:- start:1828 stop:2475 length:648 start_codon:yes stop_codon:yes gene_type:complete